MRYNNINDWIKAWSNMNFSETDQMSLKNFRRLCAVTTVDKDGVLQIEEAYGTDLPKSVEIVLSIAPEGLMFTSTNTLRLLSRQEILDGVSVYQPVNSIPVIDMGEGITVVFRYDTQMWAKYNTNNQVFGEENRSFDTLMTVNDELDKKRIKY